MEKINNYDKIEEGGSSSFKHLQAGAYVCKIGGAVDCPDTTSKIGEDGNKSYIELVFDICEGEYKGYFTEQQKAFGGTFQGHVRRYYGNAKSQSFFKGFTTSVEKSNKGYKWNWDEKTLVDKKVVIVFRNEEYISKTGEVKTAVRPCMFRSIDDLKAGNIETPKLRTLEEQHKVRPATSPVASAPKNPLDVSDDDLPF